MNNSQLFEETMTGQIENNSPSSEKIISPVCVSAGDTCSPGQAGHETTDANNHILKCEKVNEYEYKWTDTGRVRS